MSHCRFRRNLVLLAALIPAVATAQTEQPNIVVLLADDLGWADVGFHGGPIETPSIDLIASQGVQLDRFYTAPMCTPTRAMLLTGRDPIRMGLAYEQVNPWDSAGLPPAEHLMPETFRAAGYQTAMVGKWHLGHTQEHFHPNSRGFDYFYGHLNTAIDYFTHARRKGLDWQRNGSSVVEQGYVTDLQGEDAARVIRERDAEKPLFLYVAFNAPHNPMQAPEERIALYADLPRSDGHLAAVEPIPEATRTRFRQARRVYAAMVHSLDLAVGKILDAIEAEGITRNTIVLFASDNGGYNAFGGDNAPLRGQKAQSFEGGVRVPAALRWPGRLDAGSTSAQMITAMDVFPTLAAAAGVPPENELPLDGSDLWPQLASGQAKARSEDLFLVSEVPIPGQVFYAAYSGPWKLVEIERPGQLETLHQLFQLERDPLEQNDVAGKNPKRVAAMAEKLAEWRKLEPPGGLRRHPVPLAGWIPPRDWAQSMQRSAKLQGADPGSDFQADMDASRSAGNWLIYMTPEERKAAAAARQR